MSEPLHPPNVPEPLEYLQVARQSVEDLNQPLRARVDALESANQRALDKAADEVQRQMLDLRAYLIAKIEAADTRLGERIEALAELTEQYQREQKYALETATAEREKSAATLREEVRAAAEVLRETTAREIFAGDENLRQHIGHQAEQVKLQNDAQKEAIEKAEAATERRFEAVDRGQRLLQENADKLLPREQFEVVSTELREGRADNRELIQALALRMTEMEARGGGEKDHAADLKSSLAIGVAVISVLAATIIGLMAMFLN